MDAQPGGGYKHAKVEELPFPEAEPMSGLSVPLHQADRSNGWHHLAARCAQRRKQPWGGGSCAWRCWVVSQVKP